MDDRDGTGAHGIMTSHMRELHALPDLSASVCVRLFSTKESKWLHWANVLKSNSGASAEFRILTKSRIRNSEFQSPSRYN